MLQDANVWVSFHNANSNRDISDEQLEDSTPTNYDFTYLHRRRVLKIDEELGKREKRFLRRRENPINLIQLYRDGFRLSKSKFPLV